MFSKKNLIRLIDFDKLHADSPGARALNDSDLTGRKQAAERISQAFYDIEAELGFVASCQCKEYRGNYYAGHVCKICGTVVSTEFAENIEHVNWLILPDHVPPVMHPVFFAALNSFLGKVKVNDAKLGKKSIPLLQSILDPSEELFEPVKTHIRAQGFRYFYKHCEEIMNFFFEVYPKTKSKKDVIHIRALYEEYKDRMWVKKIPALHPTLTPQAKECRVRTIDHAAGYIMSAAADLSALSYESKRCITDSKYVDRQLWKMYVNVIKYTEQILEKKFGDKYAHARRHVMGARIHFSARSVIVPIVEPHMGDEIHLPWKIALGGLKLEILNILTTRSVIDVEDEHGERVKRPHTIAEATAKYMRALVVYDEDIKKIIDLLIKECPYKGLPILCGRNPTLVLGAIQLLYFTKVKTDMADETIAISPRICKAPNAKQPTLRCTSLTTGGDGRYYVTYHDDRLDRFQNRVRRMCEESW